MRKLPAKLEQLRKQRAREEERARQEAAARKEDAVRVAREVGFQLERLDVKGLKEMLEGLGAGKGVGALNKQGLADKALGILEDEGVISEVDAQKLAKQRRERGEEEEKKRQGAAERKDAALKLSQECGFQFERLDIKALKAMLEGLSG